MTNKVTAQAVRDIKMGQSVEFHGLDGYGIDSGKTIAYRVGRLEGCRITARSDFDKGILTITKLPKQ